MASSCKKDRSKIITIYTYVKANSKYLKAYGGNKESSYVKYWNVDHLYG